MRILADSNVFIDFWKRPTRELIETFSSEDVVICGIVRSELMHGARSSSDLRRIGKALDGFEELTLEESDWVILGRQLYEFRTHGITVPFPDAIIALLAMKNDVPLWTKDKHFSLMKRIFPSLKLYI